MQLDKTLIAVRERRITESLDLSLHVFRSYAFPLLALLALGALPLAAVNSWFTRHLLDGFNEPAMAGELAGKTIRFTWIHMMLVVIEAPLAGVFATAYLGQAVFRAQPALRWVVRDVLRILPRVAWCHLVLRGVLPAWLLASMIAGSADFGVAEFWLLLLFLVVILRRALAPFINEIVLLERTPLWPTATSRMTMHRRSVMLHRPSGGELLYRWTVTAVFGLLLACSCFFSLLCLQGMFLDHWNVSRAALELMVPGSMWLIVGFVTVVRFLSYLDTRIRQEGWEVELRLRAEGTRVQTIGA